MARPYPLYDELLEQVKQRQEKTIDIKRICTTINNISQTMSEDEASGYYRELAALIVHHDHVHNGGVLLAQVPYDGKVMFGGKGLLVYIMNLPPMLQQIIAQFIENSSI